MKRLVLASLISMLLVGGTPHIGTVTCPTSGNKQVTTRADKAVTYTIQAPTANAGNIFWGDVNINTSAGIPLAPGDSYTGQPQGNSSAYTMNSIYFACSTNTDSINFIYQ
jgi:hypothetical protein